MSPSVEESRSRLWARYGDHPLASLKRDMGLPEHALRFADGSRQLTYNFTSVYDEGTPHERSFSCNVMFMSQSQGGTIRSIAMQGEEYECSMLAQGNHGTVRHDSIPAPQPEPYVPHSYHHVF